uniref:Nuclear transcription factor Y subunit beta n=2 Tax=Ascaris TaxID=6251 RepID=A0A9J2PMB3_ASCLU
MRTTDGQEEEDQEVHSTDVVNNDGDTSERRRGCDQLNGDEANDRDLMIMEETIGNEDYVDGEDSPVSDGGKLILEQDRFLPIANISRLMKNVIPSTGKVAKDAKECVQECVSEFISFLTSEASDRCVYEKRKTITGEDLLGALNSLGFENYVDPLANYIKKYREANRSDRSSDSGCSPSTFVHSSAGEESQPQSETAMPTNVISLQSVPIPVGGECSAQIILAGEENSGSALRVLTSGNVQHLQLLMDPSTGQHYINVQTSNGTQQLLPVQTAGSITSVEGRNEDVERSGQSPQLAGGHQYTQMGAEHASGNVISGYTQQYSEKRLVLSLGFGSCIPLDFKPLRTNGISMAARAASRLNQRPRLALQCQLRADSMMISGFIFAAVISSTLAANCESPKYSSTTFSTTDAFFHFSTTYIVEFTLQCANNPKDMAIYGVVNGKAYQAAVLEETSKHQISWQLDHEQSGAQTFNVHIYDEDGYAAYRKAERHNEDPSKVKPLFTVDLKHPGVSKASPVASETVVTLLALAWLYVAYTFKSQLMS